MTRAHLLFGTLLTGFLASAPSPHASVGAIGPASPRRRAAVRASEAFLNTHLFTNGRGMHFAAPGIVPLFRFFERTPLPLDVNGIMGRYLGANMEDRRAVGMFVAEDHGAQVIALGCALCHSGRAAGRLIPGLGNKRIDVAGLGTVGHAIVESYRLAGSSRTGDAEPVTTALKDPRWTNHTRGLVPDSMIQQWFYRSAALAMPDDLPAAAVKVPHLWGYGEKRKIGLFSDGLGDGSEPGWAAMVELATGQTPETVRGYRRRLEDVEKGLEELLPPDYPFAIDPAVAARGRGVFEETCSGCHGAYRRDADRAPLFDAPRFIPWESVGTDPQRLLCVTPQFRQLIAKNPLHDLIRETGLPPGYFAPRLDGVWARFPYLHNASAPTIRDLLTDPAHRPAVWSLENAGELDRFDAGALGLAIARGSVDRLLRDAARGDRDVYWTARPGHSNQGHRFGTNLPEDRKRELIEYLKTL